MTIIVFKIASLVCSVKQESAVSLRGAP